MAESVNERAVFGARLAVGLVQGLALYFLYSAFEDKTWPATNGYLFAPLAMAALYIPLLAVLGIGTIRRSTLIIWIATAAAMVAGLAYYDIWHGWPTENTYENGALAETPRVLASFATFFFTAVFLFIAHALVTAGDIDRRIVAHYRTHFDVAWKGGLQLALAGVFVGIFWLLLWLGAALFNAIKLDFLQKLIEHRWFAIPATALATAAALHITDVRSVLVRGARTLILALFSWLLPLIVLIGTGFLIALAFTGLSPLWNTRMATALLLWAAAALVVLINAAYQDGEAEHRPMKLLRWAASLGGLLLLPITALAAYALYLRVVQYGWSADRISAAACILMAFAFAVGYAIAALWPKEWFRPLERWNFATAILALILIGALFSPVADPARISVASQIVRLEAGKIAPEKFDFYYLHREGGRFGKAALEQLAKTAKSPVVVAAAKAALIQSYPTYFPRVAEPAKPADLAKIFAVIPAGRHLPDSFLKQDWSTADGIVALRVCFDRKMAADWSCHAVLKDLDGDGHDEIVLIRMTNENIGWIALVTMKEKDGKWVATGTASVSAAACKGVREDVLAGAFKAVAPEQTDLELDGHRLVMQPSDPGESCK